MFVYFSITKKGICTPLRLRITLSSEGYFNKHIHTLCADECCLTIPCIEHVCNKVVYEGNLGLWDATGVSVKHRHDYRQTLSLLLVRLFLEITERNTISAKDAITGHIENLKSLPATITRCFFFFLFVVTCAKYSSEIRPAHSIQSSWGRHGLEMSAHLISIRFTRMRFSGDVRTLLTDSSSLFPWNY